MRKIGGRVVVFLAAAAASLGACGDDDSRPDTVQPDVDAADDRADIESDGEDADVAGDDVGDVEVEAPECEAGESLCGATCVDLRNSNEHCGTCDHACAAEETCIAGECQPECSCGGLACGGQCVDNRSDPSNCGTCGTVCTSPSVCADGACVAACPPGTTACGGACAYLDHSVDHCGACDTPCANLEVCAASACTLNPCAFGDRFCDCMCVPPSEANCADCGDVCDTGFTCCPRLWTEGYICVDLMSNPEYCGTCSTMCPAGNNCVDGTCTPV